MFDENIDFSIFLILSQSTKLSKVVSSVLSSKGKSNTVFFASII